MTTNNIYKGIPYKDCMRSLAVILWVIKVVCGRSRFFAVMVTYAPIKVVRSCSGSWDAPIKVVCGHLWSGYVPMKVVRGHSRLFAVIVCPYKGCSQLFTVVRGHGMHL